MTEIVNLRTVRKRKARAEAARRAAGNRARSRLREARFGARSKVGRPRVQNAMAPRHALVTRGRPKAEREKARREAERAGRALDGLRLKREEG